MTSAPGMTSWHAGHGLSDLFMVKDSEPDELIQAVRVVARGDALLSPSVTKRLITDLASRPARPPSTGRELGGLTERERECGLVTPVQRATA